MGKNVKADAEKANNAIVEDEYSKDIIDGQVESIVGELTNFRDQRVKAIAGKERFLKQWDRDKELYKIMLDNFSMIPEKITMKYEQSPRYWELKTQQFEDKYAQDKHMTEAKLSDYDRQIEAFEMEIQTAEEKLRELGELDE